MEARALTVGRIGPAATLKVLAGNVLAVTLVRFEYRGPSGLIWVCWGLKAGAGDFNNGANLEGGVFGAAQFVVPDALDFVPQEARVRAEITFDGRFRAGRLYDTYVWLSLAPSPQEALFLRRDGGAGALLDTDAAVFEALAPDIAARGTATNFSGTASVVA